MPCSCVAGTGIRGGNSGGYIMGPDTPMAADKMKSFGHVYDYTEGNALNLVALNYLKRSDELHPLQCGLLDTTDLGFGGFFLPLLYSIKDLDGIGLFSIDRCGSDVRAVRDALSVEMEEPICGTNASFDLTTLLAYVTDFSSTTLAVSEVVTPANKLIVSPSATSTELTDIPNFISTVPADNVQATVMASVAMEMGWPYMAIIHSADSYGSKGAEAVVMAAQALSNSSHLCIGAQLELSSQFDMDEIKSVLQQLADTPTKVIVLFLDLEPIKRVFEAAQELNLQGRFVYITSESLQPDPALLQGVEDVALGAIAVSLDTKRVTAFEEWVTTLTVANHSIIPDVLFEEYWQHTKKCRLQNATVVQMEYSDVCTPDMRIMTAEVSTNSYILPTIALPRALAHAIDAMPGCEDAANKMSCFKALSNRFEHLHDAMLDQKVLFQASEIEGDDDFELTFAESGFARLGYRLYNFQKMDGSDTPTFEEVSSPASISKALNIWST